MRALLVTAAIATFVADFSANAAFAQSPDYPYASRVGERSSLTRELILQREMERARHRSARIEARHWAGQTPQRPNDNRGFGMSNLYSYGRPMWAPAPAPFWSWNPALPLYGQ